MNPDMVSKWERGTKTVSPLYREMYCALFEVDGEALGFLTPSAEVVPDLGADPTDVLAQLGPAASHLGTAVLDVWKEEAMKRRTLLKMMSAPAALAASGSRPSAASSVHGLDDLADRYQTLYHAASPLDLTSVFR